MRRLPPSGSIPLSHGRTEPLRSHLRAGRVHDRPYLDGPKSGGRVVGDDLGRALDALGVEHVVAGQLFLRFGERSVGDSGETIAHAYRLARRGVSERGSFAEKLAGLGELFEEG